MRAPGPIEYFASASSTSVRRWHRRVILTETVQIPVLLSNFVRVEDRGHTHIGGALLVDAAPPRVPVRHAHVVQAQLMLYIRVRGRRHAD